MMQFFHYFVDPLAPIDSPRVTLGLILAAILFVGSFVISILSQSTKRKRVHPLLVLLAPLGQLTGILWLILFFLRYEGLAPFQYRIWIYSVWLIVIIWGGLILKRYKREKPKIGREVVLKDRYEQYLPQPKRLKRK